MHEVLSEFEKIFGLENAKKEDLINIHRCKEHEKRFQSLSYEKRTLTATQANKIVNADWMQDLLKATDMLIVDAYGFGYLHSHGDLHDLNQGILDHCTEMFGLDRTRGKMRSLIKQEVSTHKEFRHGYH